MRGQAAEGPHNHCSDQFPLSVLNVPADHGQRLTCSSGGRGADRLQPERAPITQGRVTGFIQLHRERGREGEREREGGGREGGREREGERGRETHRERETYI